MTADVEIVLSLRPRIVRALRARAKKCQLRVEDLAAELIENHAAEFRVKQLPPSREQQAPYHVLSEQMKARIRAVAACEELSSSELGERFGVSGMTVRRLLGRE